MNFSVIGIRRVNFTTRDDAKRQITGYSIYTLRPVDPNEGTGEYFTNDDKIFVSDYFLTNYMGGVLPKVGQLVAPVYNRRGRLESLEIIG